MAQTLERWLETIVNVQKETGAANIGNFYFHRDPFRPIFRDKKAFYSPADGTILYQKDVEPDDAIVEIKGRNFTTKELLGDEYFDQRAYVVGVFMTFYDCHVNRIPYDGIIRWKKLEPISTSNYPMMAIETGLLDALNVNPDDLDYLFWNERTVNEVYIPHLNYHYYVVQIADIEVDVISHFVEQEEFVPQNYRFGEIRYGSQVDLVLPYPMPFEIEQVFEDHVHVEAGVDKLIKFK